jgi:SAM-dependent methyltransferase
MSDDLVAFYEAGYSTEDPAEAARYGAWRAHGARLKAGHAATLCERAGLRPHTLVEIGCGDGALLQELGSRGLATVLDGVELSAPAAEMARARAIPGARRIEAYDGAHVPAEDGAYDLAVLSHVLEHVPDPPALLAEAARVARWVLAEVPLEANRSAARPAKRAQAREIGHIQAFSRADMHALMRGAGLALREELTDPLPYSHHAFFAADRAARGKAGVKWAARAGLWRASPRRAEHLFTVHWAGLAASGGPGAR